MEHRKSSQARPASFCRTWTKNTPVVFRARTNREHDKCRRFGKKTTAETVGWRGAGKLGSERARRQPCTIRRAVSNSAKRGRRRIKGEREKENVKKNEEWSS